MTSELGMSKKSSVSNFAPLEVTVYVFTFEIFIFILTGRSTLSLDPLSRPQQHEWIVEVEKPPRRDGCLWWREWKRSGEREVSGGRKLRGGEREWAWREGREEERENWSHVGEEEEWRSTESLRTFFDYFQLFFFPLIFFEWNIFWRALRNKYLLSKSLQLFPNFFFRCKEVCWMTLFPSPPIFVWIISVVFTPPTCVSGLLLDVSFFPLIPAFLFFSQTSFSFCSCFYFIFSLLWKLGYCVCEILRSPLRVFPCSWHFCGIESSYCLPWRLF